MKSLAIAFFCSCIATIVLAQEWMLYGPTNNQAITSCGTFNIASAEYKNELSWWVGGFVSGEGRELAFAGHPLSKTDPDGLDSWLRKYCTEHPLDTVVHAAILLVDELKRP